MDYQFWFWLVVVLMSFDVLFLFAMRRAHARERSHTASRLDSYREYLSREVGLSRKYANEWAKARAESDRLLGHLKACGISMSKWRKDCLGALEELRRVDKARRDAVDEVSILRLQVRGAFAQLEQDVTRIVGGPNTATAQSAGGDEVCYGQSSRTPGGHV